MTGDVALFGHWLPSSVPPARQSRIDSRPRADLDKSDSAFEILHSKFCFLQSCQPAFGELVIPC
jgi:hypothetical protein